MVLGVGSEREPRSETDGDGHMRASTLIKLFRSSVAVGAIVVASAAHAACNTANGVVTCTDASTTNDANNAIFRTPPPSVTVVIAPGATVNGGFNSQIIVGSFFRGGVGYTNDGVVGTPDRPTDFVTFGNIGSATNTFTLINRGTQNGGISALGMGGAMTGINSGLVTRGITLSGAGPITFNNTGTVFQSNNLGALATIRLDSSRTIFTVAADGTQRFADAGGLVTATIAGRVGRLATGGTPGSTDGVSVRGVGGADVTVTGQMGVLEVNAGGSTSERQFSSNFNSGFSFTDVASQRTNSADGRITLGETGSVTSIFFGATGNATAIINGTVAGGFNTVNVSSGASESSTRQTSISGNGSNPSSQSSSSSYVNAGQAALVDIGATGRVLGNVSAGSNGGTVTVRVAGAVGDTRSAASITARSVSNNSVSQFDSLNRADGSSMSSNSSTSTLSGGAAIVTIATTGTVAGSISADGDASATVNNAGRVGGIFANSGRTLTTSFSSNQSQTVANGVGGLRTFGSQSNSSRVDETLGGFAQVTNAATGLVEGSVQVTSFGGATLDNAGTIRGSVFLSSAGTRTTSASSDRRQQTTILLPNGSAVTTSLVQDSSSMSSARATGGAVTSTFSGTVGVAQPSNFGGSSSINQSATTISAASITGTVFANFVGNAGAQNTDTASTSASRQITQLNGASTREQSSTFSQTIGQGVSTSTLTVGSNGVVANNGSGTGNVSLVSVGGDARFALDGGRVDGTVSVTGGTGSDTTQTSTSSASFTRAAQTSPFIFVPEIQQTQTNVNTFETRAVRGAGTATINAGTIGGDLMVSGTKTGTGTVGAGVVVDGMVTGLVSATSLARNTTSSTNDSATRSGPNTVVRTITNSSTVTPLADGGNVLVSVSGVAGSGIQAAAGTGSATVNLAGRAGTVAANGVSVTAVDFASQRDSTQTSTSANFFSSFPLTASRVTTSMTPTGGTATLNVTPSAMVGAGRLSSIEGEVVVSGLSGSTLNVAAGARILQATGNVSVGGNYNTTTTDTTGVFTNGVQTGSTGTSSGRFSAGPAAITNAGTIGSVKNQASLTAAGVGGAAVRNAGTIDGSIFADARGASRATTTTTTDSNNFALRRTVVNNVIIAAGGTALVDNSGLVTGAISAIGATGTVTNSGVVRGAVTLGGGFVNFNTTVTTTINPTTGASVITTTVSPAAALFNQTYRLDQNGLLLGGVNVTGTSTIDPSGGTTRTSNVDAAVNLNNGSIMLGNITAVSDSTTNVSLNGAGFLGVAANDLSTNLVPGQIVTGFVPTPSLTRFSAIDPALGVTVPLASGSRISGVQTVTKTGDGTFVIVGAPTLAATGTTPLVNTLDVATLRVVGGELELGLAGTTATANTLGIRGNVENAASLVVGRRISDGTQMAVRGINVAVGGNLNNAPTGSLVVGVNPSFVRPNAAATFVPFGGSVATLGSTNSFVRVDGNLTLAGAVNVLAPTGGIYEAGRAYDLFNVGGTYANTGTVQSNLASPFISFTLTPRSEGGRTIVSLNVARANFDTVATDRNAAAAAQALQAAIGNVANGLRAGSAGSQDLASVIAALDTQFTAAQSAEAFRQLSSGEFYGSLAAISTTVPFGEATDGLSPPGGPSGIGLWFRPTGQFATYKANEQFGASAINLDNYGGSIGLNYATGSGGHVGIAGGYSALNVRAAGTPERARAKTYMVGAYASQELDKLHVSAQAVYGRSDWDASRGLPIFGRIATSSFKSTEVRASLRVAYAIDLDTRFELTPFARGELRYFRFDGFDEQGAGSIGLSIGRRSKTVFNPEVGVRIEGSPDDSNHIRPFAEGSYVFQSNPGTDRQMSFLGNSGTAFSVTGVRPGDAIKAAVGVSADVGRTSLFVRGDYASGGMQQVGSVRGGVLLRF